MTVTEILKSIMKHRGVGNSVLAKRLGVADARIIYERINQKNISIAKLNEILRVMDYEIVIQPTTKGDGEKYKVD